MASSNKTGLKLRREQQLGGESRTLAPLNIVGARLDAGSGNSSRAGTRPNSPHPPGKADMAMYEEQAKRMSIAELQKELLGEKLQQLDRIKSNYETQLQELFFLQSGGHMMDFSAWKKKPNKQREEFMNQNRLDEEDDYEVQTPAPSHSGGKATDKRIPAASPSVGLPTGGVQIKAPIPRKDMGRMTATPGTSGSKKNRFFSSPDSATPTPATPLPVPPTPGTSTGPHIRLTPITPRPSSMSTTASSPFAMAPAAGIGPTEEDTQETARENAIVKRIADLHREGLWPSRRLPIVYEPPRPFATWDYLLREMEVMAIDFAQELRWKKEAAKMVREHCCMTK